MVIIGYWIYFHLLYSRNLFIHQIAFLRRESGEVVVTSRNDTQTYILKKFVCELHPSN